VHDLVGKAGGRRIVETIRKIITDKNIDQLRFPILVMTHDPGVDDVTLVSVEVKHID
jgi:hypothetical protein